MALVDGEGIRQVLAAKRRRWSWRRWHVRPSVAKSSPLRGPRPWLTIMAMIQTTAPGTSAPSSVARRLWRGALLLGLVGSLACAARGPRREPSARSFMLLAVNDIYRIDGIEGGAIGGLARLRQLRREQEARYPDLLLLHGGDFLYPSLLSRTYDGRQMIDVMNRLDGKPGSFDARMFATFGNHEFEKRDRAGGAALADRMRESEFAWLGTNVEFVPGAGPGEVAEPSLARVALVLSGGVRVGLFSITTDFVRPEYVAAFADPVVTARAASARLRADGAEVVVALTHLELDQDRALVETLGAAGPDLVIGGHDHESSATEVGGRVILKADADARTATEATVTVSGGAIRVAHRIVPLGPSSPRPDPAVAERVAWWRHRHEHEFCGVKLGLPDGCLDDVLGHTRTRLGAEEIEIRRFETSLGDWVTDRMVEAFRDRGAQVAFVNAGSLRLNQDVPAGSDITRRHVEELFAYSAPLRLLAIDGATLRSVLERAVENWTGNGWWLQVSGLAFRHDPRSGAVRDLTLLGPEGPRPIGDRETIRAVTVDFLVDPRLGQDGFTMLAPTQVLADGPDLKEVVRAALARAGTTGIAPSIEGRICNRPGPCLAVPAVDSRREP